MTKETFLECVNGVDDDLVEAVKMADVKASAEDTKTENVSVSQEGYAVAEEKGILHRKTIKVIEYVAIAACFVVLVGTCMTALTPSVNNGDHQTNIAEATTKGTTPTSGVKLTGEQFYYNNVNYRVVDSQEFLASNSLPTEIEQDEVGECLQNNVGSLINNTILGDVYAYKNSDDLSVLIVKLLDGSYKMAVDEEKYEKEAK